MRLFLTRCLLFAKRFWRKPTFVLLLLLIPAVTVALGVVAKEESAFIHVALARETDSETASKAIEALTADGTLMRFTVCDTPEEAVNRVIGGAADAAWIFTADVELATDELAAGREPQHVAVRIVERESNLLMRLSHEKLAGALYRTASRRTYVRYARTVIDEAVLSDAVLLENFDTAYKDMKLFDFSAPTVGAAPEVGYLVAPVRGVLSVLMVLCAMTTALFFGQDEQKGTFAWVPLSRRPLTELACQAAAVVSVGAVAFAAMAVAGVLGLWWREALLMLLYMVSCAWFAMLLRQLTVRLHRLAILIPVLAVGMLAVCPVFLEVGSLRSLQLLFPPTYYLYAAGNDRFAWYLLAYTAVLAVLTLGVYYLRMAGMIFRKKA